ncbi:unnamed protein product [Rhizoctonia solani]|uniref:DUF6533 domain-containing protein n=1 Tax=Rhizoctonia solani TaxID=456999 RepID=A0A8H2Y4W4_9AGAM|nr:unnamed protein product [Rhizoctonia solani]
MLLYTHSEFDTSYVALVASESQYKRFLDLIITTRMQGMIARHLAVSGIALLLYDWLTNLDKEAEYAWARQWSIARVVYHLNRVLPILLIGATLIPTMMAIVCITSIIRCWALYGQRWVLWCAEFYALTEHVNQAPSPQGFDPQLRNNCWARNVASYRNNQESNHHSKPMCVMPAIQYFPIY